MITSFRHAGREYLPLKKISFSSCPCTVTAATYFLHPQPVFTAIHQSSLYWPFPITYPQPVHGYPSFLSYYSPLTFPHYTYPHSAIPHFLLIILHLPSPITHILIQPVLMTSGNHHSSFPSDHSLPHYTYPHSAIINHHSSFPSYHIQPLHTPSASATGHSSF